MINNPPPVNRDDKRNLNMKALQGRGVDESQVYIGELLMEEVKHQLGPPNDCNSKILGARGGARKP